MKAVYHITEISLYWRMFFTVQFKFNLLSFCWSFVRIKNRREREKVEIFVIYRSKYLQKNDQNSVFVSEAVHGEIIIWNNQIFEEGYLSHPKYLGPTVWFNIQLVPKSFSKYYWILLWLWLFMTQVVKYTMKVKVIKYFLQIFVIWNNGAEKKWGARYTFCYKVLLTLCNGDRRIVHWLSSPDQHNKMISYVFKIKQCFQVEIPLTKNKRQQRIS